MNLETYWNLHGSFVLIKPTDMEGGIEMTMPMSVEIVVQLTAALDKKEALLQQLRAMNDEATAGSQVDPVTKRHSDSFQRAYAGVVLELTKVQPEPPPLIHLSYLLHCA